MLRAHRMGMVSGDYAFVTMDLTPPKAIVYDSDVWLKNDGYDEDAKKAFSAVFHVSMMIANSLLQKSIILIINL